ncbi:MAG: CBS domain-containing protein [Marmoricola sp.]
MTRAREVMTGHARWAASSDTLVEAARKMRDWQLRLLPIRGADERLAGIVTDRDIVIHCVAEGTDPATVPVTTCAQGEPVTIGADDSLERALSVMIEHGVRQLPVVDCDVLVGMITQADVARHLAPELIGTILGTVSSTTRRH